jgi:hypothetical protein
MSGELPGCECTMISTGSVGFHSAFALAEAPSKNATVNNALAAPRETPVLKSEVTTILPC